jgi:hypothetical protein
VVTVLDDFAVMGYIEALQEVVLMRNLAIAVLFSFFVLEAVGQQSTKIQLLQIPNGTLSGNTYTNNALGLSYQIPDGWKGDPDPKGVLIDWRGLDKVANRCSRVLLWLTLISTIEGRFNPVATVFVTDPACLGVAAFPESLEQVKEINKVAKKMGDSFNYTPFMSPYGNVTHPFISQGRVVIQATGGLVINAVTGDHVKTKEPLEVKTSFTFTEANGYLIVWAYVANESSAEPLENMQVRLKTPPTR